MKQIRGTFKWLSIKETVVWKYLIKHDLVWFLLYLTLLLLSTTCPVLANSVEANWSGSALFVIKYVNFYQKPGSSNLISWKLEVGVAS